MDDHTLNNLVAQISAVERVVTLLLAEALKSLPMEDAGTLEMALSPKMTPPPAPDINTADHWAGRTIEYERVVARILKAAQEIADVLGGRTK